MKGPLSQGCSIEGILESREGTQAFIPPHGACPQVWVKGDSCTDPNTAQSCGMALSLVLVGGGD